MGVGTSAGAFYEDAFHYETEQWRTSDLSKAVDQAMSGMTPEMDAGMVLDPNQAYPDATSNDRNVIEPSTKTPDFKTDVAAKKTTNPDYDYIQNIDKDPGLFQPIAEDMQGEFKPLADNAKIMTKQLYDFYKSGDADAVKAVQDWENKTLGAGYNDTDAGKALKKESIDNYGSKTTMSRSAIWEAYHTLYANQMNDLLEHEDTPEDRKPELEAKAHFDRDGRPQMDMRALHPRFNTR